MKFALNESTRFCVATPSGRGAVATIAMRGESCVEIINRVFDSKRKRPISENDFGRIIYGNWISDGEPGEDLVVCPIDSTSVDIHCHGGEVALQIISRSLVDQGAIECEPAQFSVLQMGNRYFADLHMAITKAVTRRTATRLWDQPLWHEKMLHKLASAMENKNKHKATRIIDNCLKFQEFGMRIVSGWSVILCGEPNVGKSSLTNAVLGYNRTIVDNQAGTTRDTVETKTTIGGWPVRLTDTAGIREATGDIEQEGIRQAKQKVADADLVLLLVDARSSTLKEVESQAKLLSPDLVIANKCDLTERIPEGVDFQVSAKTGEGINTLIETIGKVISSNAPAINQPFPVTVFQVTSLAALRQYIQTNYWEDAWNLLDQMQLIAD
jgi:tRNA modification GTPase